jgi:hypothetical protein
MSDAMSVLSQSRRPLHLLCLSFLMYSATETPERTKR